MTEPMSLSRISAIVNLWPLGRTTSSTAAEEEAEVVDEEVDEDANAREDEDEEVAGLGELESLSPSLQTARGATAESNLSHPYEEAENEGGEGGSVGAEEGGAEANQGEEAEELLPDKEGEEAVDEEGAAEEKEADWRRQGSLTRRRGPTKRPEM